MAENQLWACQSAGPLTDLISKSKTFSNRENSLYSEHVCPFLHLFMENTTLSLPQHTIYSAWYRERHTQLGFTNSALQKAWSKFSRTVTLAHYDYKTKQLMPCNVLWTEMSTSFCIGSKQGYFCITPLTLWSQNTCCNIRKKRCMKLMTMLLHCLKTDAFLHSKTSCKM